MRTEEVACLEADMFNSMLMRDWRRECVGVKGKRGRDECSGRRTADGAVFVVCTAINTHSKKCREEKKTVVPQ